MSETVDALVLAARFDQIGLEKSGRVIVAEAQRVSAVVNRRKRIGVTSANRLQIHRGGRDAIVSVRFLRPRGCAPISGP